MEAERDWVTLPKERGWAGQIEDSDIGYVLNTILG